MGLRVGHRKSGRTRFTSAVSFLSGAIIGLLIAALQIVAGHASIDYRNVELHGNGLLAVAVPVFLLPLAIAWGWTWVSDRWSGRSGPRLLLFTVGLVLAASSAFPIDYALFPTSGDVGALVLADVTLQGMLFVLPVVALAAVLYWAYASGKVSASFGTLALGYLGGVCLALVLPTLTMGAVAGTAAGNSWQHPNSRGRIAFLVLLLMFVGVFELPIVANRLLQ
jgi:MFS family permease